MHTQRTAAAAQRTSCGSSAPAVPLYRFVCIKANYLPGVLWAGVQSLPKTKAGQAFQIFLAEYTLCIKKKKKKDKRQNPLKLKPGVPASPRAGASAFVLQHYVCTSTETSAEVTLLPGPPARPALGTGCWTPDPAPAPCCCLHRSQADMISDSSVTGLGYSSWHRDGHRSLPRTPSRPSADFCPCTTPPLTFNFSLSFCFTLANHPASPEPLASPGSAKPCTYS